MVVAVVPFGRVAALVVAVEQVPTSISSASISQVLVPAFRSRSVELAPVAREAQSTKVLALLSWETPVRKAATRSSTARRPMVAVAVEQVAMVTPMTMVRAVAVALAAVRVPRVQPATTLPTSTTDEPTAELARWAEATVDEADHKMTTQLPELLASLTIP